MMTFRATLPDYVSINYTLTEFFRCMAEQDYKALYEEKCAELNELDSHFQTFQGNC